MIKREGTWALIFRSTMIWLALLSAANLAALLVLGDALPWFLLPIVALFMAIGMMAIA